MKKFLISTALIATAASAASAQNAENPFRASPDPMEIHASEFIGMRIYQKEAEVGDAAAGAQTDWKDIGEINDVILTRDGEVEAVLVDIGGFLGIGENQVAVDMGAIRFVSDSSTEEDTSDFFLVMNTPRAAFETAPVYHTEQMAMAGTHGDEMKSDMATGAKTAEPTQEYDGYTHVAKEDLTADKLTGAPAYDANDERIGEVSELILADDGNVDAAIVDVGGFLGIGEKPVELKLSEIDIVQSDEGNDVRVYISMTREELEALPSYEG